jgi:hypothetical protein
MAKTTARVKTKTQTKTTTKAKTKKKGPRGTAHLARAKKAEHDLDALYEALHYREFKILLKSEDFDEAIHTEVHDYWKLARRVAGELLIHVRRGKLETEPHYRDIVFLDTPKFDLYRNGFMLRVRRPYVGTEPAKQYELTLKFRGADIARAGSMDLSPAKGIVGRSKFKEELLLVSSQLGGMRSSFSHTTQLLERTEPIGKTFGDFVKMFPHLKTLKIKPTTKIAPAAPVPVQEVLFDLGEFGFAGAKTAKVNMAVWRNPNTKKILIGEFAYETHFRHYGRLHPVPKLRSERLYRLLQRETGSWVELGTTKTSLYYGLSGKKLGRDE